MQDDTCNSVLNLDNPSWQWQTAWLLLFAFGAVLSNQGEHMTPSGYNRSPNHGEHYSYRPNDFRAVLPDRRLPRRA